jgi:hypothetical protein
MTATTQSGAAESSARRGSRGETLDSINERRIGKLKEEGVEVEYEPDGQAAGEVEVDEDDAAAEAERKKLEAEAKKADDDEAAAAAAATAKGGAAPSKAGRVEEDDDTGVVVIDPTDEASAKRYKIRAKVDGQDVELDLNQAQVLLQKDASANRKMADAAAQMKAADEKMREADALLAKARENPGDKDAKVKAEEAKAAAEKLEDEISAKVKDVATALYEGDADKATAGLVEILKGRTSATPNDDDTVERLTQQVKAKVKSELSAESALTEYREAYPEIASNRRLDPIADGFFDEAVKAGKSTAEALTFAGDKTRELLKEQAKQYGMVEADQKSTIEKRSERIAAKKDDMEPGIRSAGAPAATAAAEAPAQGDHRKEIAEMSAKRHGGRFTT